MNTKLLTCTALLAMASVALPACAAPKGKKTSAAPVATATASAELDGIIFKNHPYTILTVKALSLRDSDDEGYNYTVVLRFHRDKDKGVDIKVLAPGMKRDEWNSSDEWGEYATPTSAPADASDYEKEAYSKARLHYILPDREVNDLALHVQSIGKVSGGKATIKLINSSYTYILGGGSKLFTYEFAPTATIQGSSK